MSGKKLLPGFADDDEDDEDQIKSTEADITTLFRECEKRLREMGRTKTEGTTDEVKLAAHAWDQAVQLLGRATGGHPFFLRCLH